MSRMPKVFVTQQNMVRNADGSLSPKFNTSPAKEYGDLVHIFGPGHIEYIPEVVCDAINEQLDLHHFNPETDYLLTTGKVELGVQAAILMMGRGGCRALSWDGMYKRYQVVKYLQGVTYDER